jgi:DNA repair protein RecN (Recombination protein N)
LADTHFQLNVVDVMANTTNLLKDYREKYDEYIALSAQLADWEAKAKKTGEQAELEQEQDTLLHTEDIKSSLYKLIDLLDGDEQGAIQQLKESLSAMESLKSYFPKAVEYAERLQSAFIDLKDLAAEAAVLKEDIEFDPDRLEWVRNRLNTLYSLQQKHRVKSLEELIVCREQFGKQLKAIDSYDEEITSMRKKLDAQYQILEKQAIEISELRKKAAQGIEQQLEQRMKFLNTPNIRIQIDFEPRSKPMEDGIDEIYFLFSANKNESLKPVAQIASGGEISRLMLCIKAMIAGNTALPAIIFDEIDTGTSGETADKMAGIMQNLGRKMQVITITHLPQIAAKGNAHYFVYKEDTDERTLTRIRPLNTDERVYEIARMLSGASLTEASLANAKELLKHDFCVPL